LKKNIAEFAKFGILYGNHINNSWLARNKVKVMAYILDVMKGSIEPRADRISLEQYIREHSYITKYLSRVVKDKALAIYHVLFYLSYFETGKSEIIIPWAKVGLIHSFRSREYN